MSGAGGIFISCGEASGDGYAAGLIEGLRGGGHDGSVCGMLGPKAVAEGGEAVADYSELHIMGLKGVLAALPRLFDLKRRLTEAVFARNPSAVVVIDSSDFHFPFIAGLRKGGWTGPVVYAVPPAVWAWRSRRVRFLARNVDLCLPLYRFEQDFLSARGVPSEWRGHPMVDRFPAAPTPPEAGNRTVALFPGSRGSEVDRLLPPLMDCADRLEEAGCDVVFSLAPGLSPGARERARGDLGGRAVFEGEGADLLARVACAAGASGTLAVEAMMRDRFMTVLYRFGALEAVVARAMVRTPRVSIPNILAGEDVYPELIQGKATGENAARALLRYLGGEGERERTHRALAVGRAAMGCGGAFRFWGERILALVAKHRTAGP